MPPYPYPYPYPYQYQYQYQYPYPYPQGKCLSPESPECTGKGGGAPMESFPNKNVWVPPSPGKGTAGAYECVNGFPAGPPSPSTSSVMYLQRIGSGSTSDGDHEIAWSTNLFGCLADFNTCLKTCFCPCITSGQIAEIVSEGKTSCLEATIIHGLLLYLFIAPSIYTCLNRSKLRKRFKLKGNNFTDCLTHTFCCFCALCQEYRELYNQGYDPAIGWLKNIERDRNTVAVFRITPPMAEKGMVR
nr:protein PLANT CADMIUM RESISTANCE 7-like [Ipomoea batatas]